MTKEDMKTKRQLQPVIQQARDENKKFRFTKGKLFIEGKLYNPKYDHAKKDSHQKPQPRSHTFSRRSAQRAHTTSPQQSPHNRQQITPPSKLQHRDHQQHRPASHINLDQSHHQNEQQPSQPPLPQLPNSQPGQHESLSTQEQQPVTGNVPVQKGQ